MYDKLYAKIDSLRDDYEMAEKLENRELMKAIEQEIEEIQLIINTEFF